jgi:hypothetical protein
MRVWESKGPLVGVLEPKIQKGVGRRERENKRLPFWLFVPSETLANMLVTDHIKDWSLSLSPSTQMPILFGNTLTDTPKRA